jgi:hypothetical protein
MKTFLFGLAALPFMAGIASAGQPLTNAQMDAVTAGFSANGSADVGAIGSIVATGALTTGSVHQMLQTMSNMIVVKSSVVSQSVSTALPTIP